MRLLTPNENKDLREQENVRQIMRTQELETAAKKARLELANSQADFQSTLALNRQKWAEEEEEHRLRVNQRINEIDTLEVKKLNMLIPFDILKDGVYADMNDAQTFLTNLRKREEYAEDLTEKLQDRLDEVGGREQDLNHKELELKVREEGLENQSQSTMTGTKRLSDELIQFTALKTQQEKEILDRQNSVSLQENLLKEKEDNLNKIQQSFNDQAIRLADERGVLDRAYKEVQRMRADIPLDKKAKKDNTKAT
jgi:hypothetical protein